MRHKYTRQLDSMECGVACLSTIFKFFNCEHSMEKIKEVAEISTMGINITGMIKAASSFGFEAHALKKTIYFRKNYCHYRVLHMS